MKIAHVTDFYLPRLGGIEMQVSDLASRQHHLGHEVAILTSCPSDGHSYDAGVEVRRLTEHFRHPHPLHPVAPFAGIREILRRQYDVVHAHVGIGSPLAFFAAAAAARSGQPTVVTVHSLWDYYVPMFKGFDQFGRWSKLPIVWTAVSQAAAEPVRRIVRQRDVCILPNGIDQGDWTVEPAPRDPRQVVVAAVMRLAPRKRPLHLLRILREARRQLPPDIRLRAVILGDGPDRAVVERHLRRHRMEDFVSLPGQVDRSQIRALYERADMFVAPANLESFGIAALEARCAGVPVVAKSGGGVGEFIRQGREGFLVDSDADMTAAVVRLARDVELRERISTHNRKVECAITWAEVLRRTELAYAAATAGDRPVELSTAQSRAS
jgi:glycosyltransferase involved in cell wall biosynthesis